MSGTRSPSIARRLASMTYETLVVAAIVLAGAFAFFGAAAAARGGGPIEAGPLSRALLQGFLVALVGGYFVRCWSRGGQTLPMRAWRLRVVALDYAPLTVGRAVARFGIAAAIVGPGLLAAAVLWRHPESAAAWLAVTPALVDLAWALGDRDRQFLHDRLAGTRVIFAPPTTSSSRR
jgi:uncharacterized RDD family membrane protein YckC